LAKAQMETVQVTMGPFGERNFKFTTGVGAWSQRVKKSTAVMPFSGGQMADNNGASPESTAPNAAAAAEFARIITPLASISNAGHPEPSNPNMISGFMPLQLLRLRFALKISRRVHGIAKVWFLARPMPDGGQGDVFSTRRRILSVLP
jgi:hypothetical protein